MVPDSDFVWAMPDGSQLAEAKFTRVAETTDSGDYKCTSTIMRGKDTIETTTVINVQVKKSYLISIYPYKLNQPRFTMRRLYLLKILIFSLTHHWKLKSHATSTLTPQEQRFSLLKEKLRASREIRPFYS